jgi:hypothetical protein
MVIAAGSRMPVGAYDHLIHVSTQEWLAAGESDVKWSSPQLGENAIPFFNAHVVVRLAPDVAGAAFGITAKADTDNDREWVHSRPAEAPEAPVHGQPGCQA